MGSTSLGGLRGVAVERRGANAFNPDHPGQLYTLCPSLRTRTFAPFATLLLRLRYAAQPAALLCTLCTLFSRTPTFLYLFPKVAPLLCRLLSTMRTLRSSSNLRNRVRKTYSFFTEYAGNPVCVFEIPCFNSAHAARVCAKLSAKFKMPLEYAL